MTTRQTMVALKMRLLSGNPSAIESTGDIVRGDFGALDSYHFDMTMSDGKVYRVRVTDMTPAKEDA